jgi:bacterioferritin (cytochrome b1)
MSVAPPYSLTFAPMQSSLLANVTDIIVANHSVHARWLNSLSMMENTGARKISRYEDPVHTSITVLKHAAEEARHAYYLKKQIAKLDADACPDYSFPYLLAPVQSHHYLNMLDTEVCRYLKEKMGLKGRALKHGAYLLVTYAIEVRADMLYGIYQEALTRHSSRVNVKSIIAEEEGHLQEMQRMLEEFDPQWQAIAADACNIENTLFEEWVIAIQQEIEVA